VSIQIAWPTFVVNILAVGVCMTVSHGEVIYEIILDFDAKCPRYRIA
jgi:hypothetical protein